MTKQVSLVSGAALLAAALLAGCQGAQLLGARGVELIPRADSTVEPVFAQAPSILRTVSKDGMAHLRSTVTIKDDRPLGHAFALLGLPATWTTSIISLSSAIANPTGLRVTIPFAQYTSVAGPAFTSTITFPPLRPAADWAENAVLQNSAGTIPTTRLSGSAVGSTTGLVAGANTLNFTINVNGSEANYSVASSTNNNVVTGNSIVAGDTVTLNTGIANNQTNVSYIDVFISGAAYGSPGAPVNIARLNTAASFSTFSFNTAVNNTTAPANFIATTLVGGAGTATLGGLLDFQAYDAAGNLMGKASMNIVVFGLPAITVKVQ
jgi:hypothetical protein